MCRSIFLAARSGLNLPVVYNTNAYDSVEVLRLLEDVVDIYLPDLKYAEDEAGFLYSKVRDYQKHARAALAEMFRQVGDELVFGEDGLLKRGLVIRLLVLPNDVAGVRESLEWIKTELSPRVAISLMAQYYPTHQAASNQRFILLSRRISESEWVRALSALESLNMEEGWLQEFDGAAHYYRPDFSDPDRPFRDIRDFQG
jgi:putative pyruvate formate lyase activating enzyme